MTSTIVIDRSQQHHIEEFFAIAAGEVKVIKDLPTHLSSTGGEKDMMVALCELVSVDGSQTSLEKRPFNQIKEVVPCKAPLSGKVRYAGLMMRSQFIPLADKHRRGPFQCHTEAIQSIHEGHDITMHGRRFRMIVLSNCRHVFGFLRCLCSVTLQFRSSESTCADHGAITSMNSWTSSYLPQR